MMRRALSIGLLALLLCGGSLFVAQAAETVTVRAAEHDGQGFGRIAFDWPAPVAYDAKIDGDTLTIHFARPLTARLDTVMSHLDDYVSAVKLAADGAGIVARLKHPATLHTFTDGNVIAIDIITAKPAKPAEPPPAGAAAAEPMSTPAAMAAATAKPIRLVRPAKAAASAPTAAPAEAPKIAPAGAVAIRFAEHPGFRRVVFDFRVPVRYTLAEKDGAARLRFDRAATLDASRLALALPGLAPAVTDEAGATIVTFTVPAGTSFRHFLSGDSVVLDVLGAGAAAAAHAAGTGIIPPPELIAPAAGTSEPEAKPGAAPAKSPTGAARPRPSAAASPPALPGALPVHYAALAPQGASLRFDLAKPTPAAVFRRGNALWIVFSGAKPLDLAEPRRFGGDLISRIDQLADARATVVRLVTEPGVNPSVRRAEANWIIELKPQEPKADTPIVVEAHPSAPTPDVLFQVGGAAEPLTLRDPDVGDALTVIPVDEVGRGIGGSQDFVDFTALASVQGIAIRANADDLRVARSPDGVILSRPGGLVLSPDTDRQLARQPGGLGRLFDFAAWRGPPGQGFLEKRSRLEQAVAAAPSAYRSKPRLALARFYFANLYAPEAEGVIEAIQRDDPALAADPSVQLMTGAVHLLAGDQALATQELAQKNLDGEPEAMLWRASLAATTGDWAAAAHGFALAGNLLPRYPKELRNRFALQAAEAFIEAKRPGDAQSMLDLVLKNDPAMSDKAMALFLDGRRALATGDAARALQEWNQVTAMDDRPSRARAMFARLMAQLDAKQISRADAIKTLDAMRFAWRGDMLEFTLLRTLGELKIADGDQRGGFDTLREAATNFPDYPASKEVMKEISDSFADVFLGKGAQDVSPVKALTLYDEFKDYAPVGEQGDAIVRRLVDRLVAVDLLDRAAALLQDQVEHRLAGREKARVATQLALVRLLDNSPGAAIKALDIDVGKDLPPELLKQRQQLRARSLAELNRNDDALALLAADTSRDADRLRADIYWRAHDWRNAAKIFARLVPAPTPEGTLDKDSAQMVLNWASALTLAGDQPGLAQLRTTYGKAMAATPFGEAFRVVAGDAVGGVGDGDPRAIANRVAQVSELQSFMASLKERLSKDKLSDIN